MIDAVRVTLMSKTEDEVHNFIEEITLNNYQWSNKKIPFKKPRGKFDADVLILLIAKWML